MCPASVKTSRASRALETGEAKLWVLLIGVNRYQDRRFPALSYSALDCQGLGEAIAAATQTFPERTVIVHHDFAGNAEEVAFAGQYRDLASQVAAGGLGLGTLAKFRSFPAQKPDLEKVRTSLTQITAAARPEDTVLFYFSGHGVLETDGQQAVLCLADTQRDDLAKTGLGVQELLGLLGACAARQQLVWLDACHSGGLTFRVAKGEAEQEELPNPTPQLMDVLRQRAAQSKGFYALLSCDQSQQSWEFPELGHGVFTYYLIRGLLGEAADAQGVIEADALYKYVYYQTLRYIDKTNQQLRLINQQKRGRGESQIQPEYPQQTPKRIVEGVGELILGLQPQQAEMRYPRQALVVDGLANSPMSLTLSKLLRGAGGFELQYWPQPGKEADVRQSIQICLQSGDLASRRPQSATDTATALIYLRGQIEQDEAGGDRLLLKNEVEISRSWLRQTLRHSAMPRQIVILDCPGATNLAEWIEDLQLSSNRGQCLIAAAAPDDQPDQFAKILLDTLSSADPQVGLPIAGWIAQIQAQLAEVGIAPQVWLSGSQGVIEVLPGMTSTKGSDAAFDLGLCPYMGLRAFGEADAPFFFGRENLTRRIINALSQQSFLSIVGASGSGKSSVVQAGVVAQLRQGKQIPGSDRWWIRSFRPGDRPLEALAQRLVDSGTEKERAYQKLQIEGVLYQGVESFVHWLRSRPEPMVMLVIDQFEELFTLAAAEDRQRFLDLVLGAVAHAGDRFKVVITLRADFITPCLEIPSLAPLIQQSSLLIPPHLNEEDYRQIITKPAEKVGLKVEPELVDVLLQELSHLAGDLPLLEFVLEQIWEHRQPGELTLQVYQREIGGLKGALERKAQSVYESLDAKAQACARWIFLSLTQLGDGTEDTRRRVLKTDLVVKKYPALLVERTLQALTAAKLVVVGLEESSEGQQSRGEGEAAGPDAANPAHESADDELIKLLRQEVTVEVAHEILIRHWSTLRWWLEENRTRLRSQRQIEQAADQWRHSGQQPDFLLRGVRLDAAEELYVKYTDELSHDVQQFIEAGLAQRNQEQEQATRRLKQARRAIAIIGALGLAAAGLGGLAYGQQRQARLNEIAALNALSEAQFLSDHSLEALVTSVRASHLLQATGRWGFRPRPALSMQTAATLQQAVEQTFERNRLEGHSQRVNAVSVSPQGNLIASASDDATVRLWQPDGMPVATLNGSDRLTSVAFSAEGLAAGSADGSILIWNPATQSVVRTLQQGDWVTDVAFSSTGAWLVTAGRDRTVKVWNVASGALLKTLPDQGNWVNGVSISANDELLATAIEDGTVKVWNLASGTLVRTLTGHSDRATHVAFSPEGNQLASASGDRTVKLWNLGDGSSLTLEGHTDQVYSVEFSADGQQLISASADGTIKQWRVSDGALLETFRGHGSEVLSAVFGADDRTIVSAGVDKSVRIWEGSAMSPEFMGAYAVGISPDQDAIAAAGWDGVIQLWPLKGEARTEARTLATQDVPILTLQFSPDGRSLATAGDDTIIHLWNPSTGAEIRTLTGHEALINNLAFSPEGEVLASASDDRTVKLWNPNNGQLLQTLNRHEDGVTSVAFSSRGDWLASGGYDNTIHLWRRNGDWVRSLSGHNLAIAAIAFSPDGQLLASASWDNTINLWQVRNGELLRTLSGHQDGVTSLAFTPDGNTLISGSADRTLKIWNPDDGTLIKTLVGHPDAVRSLTLSADGDLLVSASETAGVMRWNLNLNDLLDQGCDRLHDYLANNPTVEERDRTLCR